MNLESLERVAIIDIETDNLMSEMIDYSSFPYKLKDSAKLWCVVVRDLHTDEVFIASNENITSEWLKTVLEPYTVIVAHNGHKFDFPVLSLFGVLDYSIGYFDQCDKLFGRDVYFFDTLIFSRLFEPDRFGGHSLKEWGKRIGNFKDDFRQLCIDKCYIEKSSERGAEFRNYCPEMVDYCVQDTKVGGLVYKELVVELQSYPKWWDAVRMEHKLADLAVLRENLGFWFDKELAVKCVEELTESIQTISDKVNPLLPPKRMTKGELSNFTPPKKQLNKQNKPTAIIEKFALKHGAILEKWDEDYIFKYKDKIYTLPFEDYLETTTEATIENLDHVKMFLIFLGWQPSEWRVRDLTKDSKKQSLPLEKRIAVLDRWYVETMEGKYKESRIDYLGGGNPEEIYNKLRNALDSNRGVLVPTAPCVRVGIEKELCPSLIALGDKVEFAKDFSLFLTYRHRKSCIAGGDIEDMDFDSETPSSGYLSMYREIDGRIPTPAIEIGASTSRYRHIGVANVARASSIYGKEMRSLFGAGDGFIQLGFDFASLEGRIQGSYCYIYTDGVELSESLIAEKPNDIHSVTGRKLDIPRSDAKSINYMLLYGGSYTKAMSMLKLNEKDAKILVENFWDSVPALKELKVKVEDFWEKTGKKYVMGIDGRKVNIRSKHSILNALFQSGGVISAKYSTVRIFQLLEEQGLCISPFKGRPDVAEMISYHDECQLAMNPRLVEFKTFNSKEDAKLFVEGWNGHYPLSAVSEGTNGYYVTLPNIVSKTIEDAIKFTGERLRLRVPLGHEWVVHKNWYGCH